MIVTIIWIYLAIGAIESAGCYFALSRAIEKQPPFLKDIEKEISQTPGGVPLALVLMVFLWLPINLAMLLGIKAPH